MYFSKAQKLKMKFPSFDVPNWLPSYFSILEQRKWIKEFKKINNLKN